jgi:hypothetical protein
MENLYPFVYSVFTGNVCLTSGLGGDAKMVVAATACLDNDGLMMGQAIRLQKKGPFIAEKAMIEIVTVSGDRNLLHPSFPCLVI